MGIVAAYAVPHPPLAMPEVGRGQERAIQDTLDAYREVARRIAAHAPETIVVVSPHAPLFRDCFHLSTGDFDRGDMGRFGAWDSSMTVQYDGEMTAAIAACARKHTVPLCGSGMGGKDLDHATIVPLHFVNEAYSTYQVVRIGLSGLSPQTHLALGRCIAEAAADLDRSCVLIASGDLSHKLASDGPYGYAPQGPVFDRWKAFPSRTSCSATKAPSAWVTRWPRSRCRARPATAPCGPRLTAMRIAAVRATQPRTMRRSTRTLRLPAPASKGSCARATP